MEKNIARILPPNPFNPGTPIDPSDFVGRMREIETFKEKLRQTASGSLASMSVAGGYGIGKTSFLHKCKVIAEENNALTIYFSLTEMDSQDRETLARMLVQRLQEKVKEEVILKRIASKALDLIKKIKITISGNVEISMQDTANTDFPNLHSALISAWETIKDSKSEIVFLIDEARILEKNKAKLILYLRSVLEQLQTKNIPIMIIPSGKFTISVSSGSGFSPLVRTFPPAILENFTFEEMKTFVTKKLCDVGIILKQDLLKRVYEFTEGHPFIVSAYMASAYVKMSPKEKEMNTLHFDAADVEFTSRILASFFARFYDAASKNSRKVLHMIAEMKGVANLSDLSDKLHKRNNEISPYLAKLVQDGAIIRTDRGEYRLFHKLFGKYILQSNPIS